MTGSDARGGSQTARFAPVLWGMSDTGVGLRPLFFKASCSSSLINRLCRLCSDMNTIWADRKVTYITVPLSMNRNDHTRRCTRMYIRILHTYCMHNYLYEERSTTHEFLKLSKDSRLRSNSSCELRRQFATRVAYCRGNSQLQLEKAQLAIAKGPLEAGPKHPRFFPRECLGILQETNPDYYSEFYGQFS